MGTSRGTSEGLPSCRTGQKLIDLTQAVGPAPPRMIRWLAESLERLLSVNRINALYRAIPEDITADEFCRQCLRVLRLDHNLTAEEIDSIPSKGPLVMVANHPFGGIEGILLAALLMQKRSDVRILGNYLLTRIPALAPSIIAVDPFNPRKAARTNARALKVALDWTAGGGALLTFPAGEVSHWCFQSRRVTDPPWSPHVARLIRKAKAKTLPVYIHGRNSLGFNLAGLIHPLLRTVLLPREMAAKQGRTIHLSMGQPILWRKLTDFSSPQEATEFLRFHTYLLQHRRSHGQRRRPLPTIRKSTEADRIPIIPPVPVDLLQDELEALDPADHLVRHKEFDVYLTMAAQSPGIMREIARLRETSFREVGEGTGRSEDRDGFDEHYRQLFLWNRESAEIVGAYRLGQTDAILPSMGPAGLYTTTLFNFAPRFLDQMDTSLELGRSFIRPEYQRRFGCLSILWRGIGEFVARNLQYRYLFGPVSISQSYHAISKNLMVAFLRNNSMDPRLAPLVRPRRPVKVRQPLGLRESFPFEEMEAIEDISMLVSGIERDNKGVPTLIKHYLKLNGRFLAFNLDRAFANVIDGLVLVDLIKTEPKLLERFLGAEATRAFYARHCPGQEIRAA